MITNIKGLRTQFEEKINKIVGDDYVPSTTEDFFGLSEKEIKQKICELKDIINLKIKDIDDTF